MRDRRARARGWSTTVSCTRDTVSAGAPWASRYQQPDPAPERHGSVHRQQRFGEQDLGAVGTPGASSPVGGVRARSDRVSTFGSGNPEGDNGGMTHLLDPDALRDDARALMAPLPPYDDVARSDSAFRAFLHGLPGVDQVGAESRVAMLGTRSIKTTAKAWAIDTAISMVDLTTLEGADTPGKVRSLATKARRPDPGDPGCPQVAAV